jgi:hypothetical protein
MKKLNKIILSSMLLIASFTVLVAFKTVKSVDLSESKKKITDSSCTLYVKKSNGSLAKSMKVQTSVSGGISCSGGRTFYNDNDGKVELLWVSGCYLRKVYVDGKAYDVDYKDGKTYNLSMN